jgi:hypothetical protein
MNVDEDEFSPPLFQTGKLGLVLLLVAFFLDRSSRFYGIGCAGVVIVASFFLGYIFLPGW